MKSNGIIFIAALLLAFAGGYLFFNSSEKEVAQKTPVADGTTVKDEGKDEKQAPVTAEAEILNKNSCLTCHAVSSLGIEGGTTGPDLSGAYQGVEGKHGVDLDSFLTKPTSAVMSGVIEGNPLSDGDRADIIKLLKTASEK